jgi:hypothetical protein
MAKQSSGKKLTKRVAARKRKSKPPTPNPPITSDLMNVVAPAVGSYAASRVVGRMAYKLAKKKSDGFATHAGALTPSILAAVAWWFAHKSDKLGPYHDGIIAGTFIGAIQALVQTYVPKFGWLLNDYHMDDVLPMSTKKATAGWMPAQPISDQPLSIGDSDGLSGNDDFDVVDLSQLDAPIPGLDDDNIQSGVFSTN